MEGIARIKVEDLQKAPKMHQKMNMFLDVFSNTNLCKTELKMTSFWAASGEARSQLFLPGAPLGTTVAPKGTPERSRGGPGSLQTPKSTKMNLKTIQNQ